MTTNLTDGLNQQQADAVLNTDGPSLVIAGAGSGKTRVLTYRIAHLLQKGVKPSSVLALTFTNKAAREMKDRINRVLGNDVARYLWMGTFHSIFAKILRIESEKLGFPSTFTIYDTQDSKSLLKSIIRDMGLDEKVYKVGDVLGRISSAKNNLITPQSYAGNEKAKERDKLSGRSQISEIYVRYARRLKKAGAMDFDDLLLFTNILFRDFPDICQKYQDKFNYVLVDEYQDTNFAQYLIVKKLSERHRNVCVVGDDAQSIYSFRGAQIQNILNFRNDYPNYQLYKLEQNYRSTKTIVDAANSIIEKNEGQIKKSVFSKKDKGNLIEVIRLRTDAEEGFAVASAIADNALAHQMHYNDFAILYRTNAQSRIFEEALRKRNIPYKVYGSISFYQRKEIKDMLAYLRLLVNPSDDEALKRIINYPARGIGDTTLGKLEDMAETHQVSVWEVLTKPDLYQVNINKGTAGKLSGFVSLIEEYMAKVDKDDAYHLAYEMATASGILKDLYNGTTVEERSKYENLEELLNGIRDFVDTEQTAEELMTIHKFLENVALLTDADNEKDGERDKVSIMTIHAAKGLEFKQVFIAGVEEELFPSRMVIESPKDLEEERRLFYVALTRAMERVTISYAQTRYRWGSPTNCEPSRFIGEIDEEFISWKDDPRKAPAADVINIWGSTTEPVMGFGERKLTAKASPSPSPSRFGQNRVLKANAPIDPNFKPDPPEALKLGMMVEHQRFGKGKIVNIEGEPPNSKATVFFQQTKEEKHLLLKFARLRIVRME